jgi:hypothetical protein
MGLLNRLRGADDGAPTSASRERPRGRTRLMRDAVAMRDALDALQREAGGRTVRLDLRAVVRELLDGEVAAPTADVASLVSGDTDPEDFYERELSPSWDGLSEVQRATRLDGFFEMCWLLENSDDLAGVPADMAVNVRTRTLLLSWAFDDEYGYLPRIARGEALPG